MNELIALGLTIAGISAIIGLLTVWCRPVKFTQLGRFPGNDEALRLYEARRDMGGHGARLRD